jgi:DNA-binding NarL/FixJ family response regulator
LKQYVVGGDGPEACARELLVVARTGGALDSFSRSLEPGQRWRVTLVAETQAALRTIANGSPTVALIELTDAGPEGAEEPDGLELCRALRLTSPDIWLILVTPPSSADARVQAFQLGVQDCVSEALDPRELCALISARFNSLERLSGQYRVDARDRVHRDDVRDADHRVDLIDRRVAELTEPYGLSPRETQVLGLIARGVHPKEIADRLGCGYTSVRTHLRRLSKKLGCAGTREIVVRFFYGTLEP